MGNELVGTIASGWRRNWVLLVHDKEQNANVASFAFDLIAIGVGDRAALAAELGFVEEADLEAAQARDAKSACDHSTCGCKRWVRKSNQYRPQS